MSTWALTLASLPELVGALQDTSTSHDIFFMLIARIGVAGVENMGVSLIYLTAPILLGWNVCYF